MTKRPAASLIISSCQRWKHLQRCLLSLAAQHRRNEQDFEVIVADDGSTDATAQMVQSITDEVPFKVRFVTQPNLGFRKARIVNKAIQLVESEYVMLVDGDCLFPDGYLQSHLDDREPGTVWVSDCIRLSKRASEGISPSSIVSGNWRNRVPASLPNAMAIRYLKDRVYQFLGDQCKPKLVGNNVGLWLSQLHAINGMDEMFEGWGCEDDDLGMRLRLAGYRIKTNLTRTFGYHLWHPVDESTPVAWREGKNTSYFRRPLVFARCFNGIEKCNFNDLNVRITSAARHKQVEQRTLGHFNCKSFDDLDLEIRLGNSVSLFSKDAKRRVQVLFSDDEVCQSSFQPHLILRFPNHHEERSDPQRILPSGVHDDCLTSSSKMKADWLIARLRSESGIPIAAESDLHGIDAA